MNIKYIDTILDCDNRTIQTNICFKYNSIHTEIKKIPYLLYLISDLDTLVSIYHIFNCIKWGHLEIDML